MTTDRARPVTFTIRHDSFTLTTDPDLIDMLAPNPTSYRAALERAERELAAMTTTPKITGQARPVTFTIVTIDQGDSCDACRQGEGEHAVCAFPGPDGQQRGLVVCLWCVNLFFMGQRIGIELGPLPSRDTRRLPHGRMRWDQAESLLRVEE